MDPRDHLKAYVVRKGGARAAAEAIGIPSQTLRGVLNGWRGVSRQQAQDWYARSPWGRAQGATLGR